MILYHPGLFCDLFLFGLILREELTNFANHPGAKFVKSIIRIASLTRVKRSKAIFFFFFFFFFCLFVCFVSFFVFRFSFRFVLFCFVLFCFVLFYFVLFYFVFILFV